jgi:predicted PurR-regulated permease PerM
MIKLSKYQRTALAWGGVALALILLLWLLSPVLAPFIATLVLYGVLAVVIVFGIGHLLESFVLTPRFVGERIGMSPLMVIFALLAFGHLLGFVGVLIALPLSAVAAVAVKRLHKAYLATSLFH